jgi:O-antigen/teichoic acid export membrane protein
MLAFITLPVIILKGTYETAIIGWMFSSLLTFILAIYLKYKPFRGVKAVVESISNINILKYSLPIMVASLSGVILRFADQFFLSRYFGTEVFADYSNGFIPLPFITMITGATHAVFVPLFSGLMEKENGKASIAAHWKSGVNKMILLIYPLVIFFMFFAKEVIHILYGPLYDKSYIYFRLAMVLNFALPFLYYSILLSTGNTRFYAKLHIVHAILIWSLGFVVIKIASTPFQYMMFSVLLAVLGRIVGIIYAARTINSKVLKLIDVASILKLVVPTILIGFAAKELIELFTENITAIFILGGVIFSVFLLLADRLFHFNILKIALSFVKRK